MWAEGFNYINSGVIYCWNLWLCKYKHYMGNFKCSNSSISLSTINPFIFLLFYFSCSIDSLYKSIISCLFPFNLQWHILTRLKSCLNWPLRQLTRLKSCLKLMERETLIDDEHCEPNLKSFPIYFDNSSYIIDIFTHNFGTFLCDENFSKNHGYFIVAVRSST